MNIRKFWSIESEFGRKKKKSLPKDNGNFLRKIEQTQVRNQINLEQILEETKINQEILKGRKRKQQFVESSGENKLNYQTCVPFILSKSALKFTVSSSTAQLTHTTLVINLQGGTTPSKITYTENHMYTHTQTYTHTYMKKTSKTLTHTYIHIYIPHTHTHRNAITNTHTGFFRDPSFHFLICERLEWGNRYWQKNGLDVQSSKWMRALTFQVKFPKFSCERYKFISTCISNMNKLINLTSICSLVKKYWYL